MSTASAAGYQHHHQQQQRPQPQRSYSSHDSHSVTSSTPSLDFSARGSTSSMTTASTPGSPTTATRATKPVSQAAIRKEREAAGMYPANPDAALLADIMSLAGINNHPHNGSDPYDSEASIEPTTPRQHPMELMKGHDYLSDSKTAGHMSDLPPSYDHAMSKPLPSAPQATQRPPAQARSRSSLPLPLPLPPGAAAPAPAALPSSLQQQHELQHGDAPPATSASTDDHEAPGAPSRQRVVNRQPTSGRRVVSVPSESTSAMPHAAVAAAPSRASAPLLGASPAEGPKPHSVRVIMADVSTVNLEWDAPDIDPATVSWLTPATVHILENQRLLIDMHEDTPEEERKWLINTAVELYFPMRKRFLEVAEVLRLSFPGYSLAPLNTIIPPPRSHMRRTTFEGSGRVPVLPTPLELPRLTLPNAFRNTFRMLQYVDTGRRALWVPAGVVFDIASGHRDIGKVVHVGPEARDDFRSVTMNSMFVHALRRVMGTRARTTSDIQAAMGRAALRMLSFHPDAVDVREVGGFGGVIDVALPPPRGLPQLPGWHQPARVYLTQGTEYVFETAIGTPRWRLEEVKMILDEHIGARIEAWDDIRRILRAFAPHDKRLSQQLFMTAPACRRQYERRRFTPRVTRAGAGGGGVPRGQRATTDLPHLLKASKGRYVLEYPDDDERQPATLDCTFPEPRVGISEGARDTTMMVCWLFGIVACIFEDK